MGILSRGATGEGEAIEATTCGMGSTGDRTVACDCPAVLCHPAGQGSPVVIFCDFESVSRRTDGMDIPFSKGSSLWLHHQYAVDRDSWVMYRCLVWAVGSQTRLKNDKERTNIDADDDHGDPRHGECISRLDALVSEICEVRKGIDDEQSEHVCGTIAAGINGCTA